MGFLGEPALCVSALWIPPTVKPLLWPISLEPCISAIKCLFTILYRGCDNPNFTAGRLKGVVLINCCSLLRVRLDEFCSHPLSDRKRSFLDVTGITSRDFMLMVIKLLSSQSEMMNNNLGGLYCLLHIAQVPEFEDIIIAELKNCRHLFPYSACSELITTRFTVEGSSALFWAPAGPGTICCWSLILSRVSGRSLMLDVLGASLADWIFSYVKEITPGDTVAGEFQRISLSLIRDLNLCIRSASRPLHSHKGSGSAQGISCSYPSS